MDKNVVCIPERDNMSNISPWSHEEADTRIVVDIADAVSAVWHLAQEKILSTMLYMKKQIVLVQMKKVKRRGMWGILFLRFSCSSQCFVFG